MYERRRYGDKIRFRITDSLSASQAKAIAKRVRKSGHACQIDTYQGSYALWADSKLTLSDLPKSVKAKPKPVRTAKQVVAGRLPKGWEHKMRFFTRSTDVISPHEGGIYRLHGIYSSNSSTHSVRRSLWEKGYDVILTYEDDTPEGFGHDAVWRKKEDYDKKRNITKENFGDVAIIKTSDKWNDKYPIYDIRDHSLGFIPPKFTIRGKLYEHIHTVNMWKEKLIIPVYVTKGIVVRDRKFKHTMSFYEPYTPESNSDRMRRYNKEHGLI